MGHVLIVGCGFVGSALGVRLAAEGHVVWGLRREPTGLPTAIRPVEADVRVPNTLRRLPRVDQVFYMVAPQGRDSEALGAARVDGLRYLLGALVAGRHRVRRLFYVSSLAVYGDREGAWVDEDSEVQPASSDGRALWEGERLAADGPFAATVVRLGDVYGPGRLGLLEPVLERRSLAVARPTEYLNAIHRDDVAGALCHLAARPKPDGLYLIVDREPVARVEAAHWLATRLGREMPALEPSDGPPAADVRAMSERLRESGYHLRYPTFREGYEPIVKKLGG